MAGSGDFLSADVFFRKVQGRIFFQAVSALDAFFYNQRRILGTEYFQRPLRGHRISCYRYGISEYAVQHSRRFLRSDFLLPERGIWRSTPAIGNCRACMSLKLDLRGVLLYIFDHIDPCIDTHDSSAKGMVSHQETGIPHKNLECSGGAVSHWSGNDI